MSQIDYTPTDNVYGYVQYDPMGDVENNKAVKFLLSEFECLKKNIISKHEALKFWLTTATHQGVYCSFQDIENAYTVAYGHGCEYEWELA